MMISHSVQMTAEEYAAFEPLALDYIERCRDALARGDYHHHSHGLDLEGILPKLRRGEMVHLVMSAFSAVADPLSDLTACSAKDKAILEALKERLFESEQVDIQTVRAGQKPYIPYGERKRRSQGS